MKFPIGIQTFEEVIGEGYVYVDKTDMVYSLATEGKIYFLGRPRRFGKSLLLSTLESYFLGKRELFKGLKIDSLEKEWKTYPVFHMDFNGLDYTDSNTLHKKLNTFFSDYEAVYGTDERDMTIGDRFAKLLHRAHEKTGQKCVVLIDEYDKPMLDVMETKRTVSIDGDAMSLEEYNREILRAFYSTFKVADRDLKFVFLTGITKFSQVSIFSGLNQLTDISMEPQFETICGITNDEIETYFHEEIAKMADANGCAYDMMRKALRAQYDGYHFSKNMADIYNPFSLLNALRVKDIGDYWFATGTPTVLDRMLSNSDLDIDEIIAGSYSRDQFMDYRANSLQLLPLFYQSGYLTIKEFDPNLRTFKLDFPNNEVKNGLVTMVANSYLKGREDTGNVVRNLVNALDRCDLDAFRECFDTFLASIPYDVRRKSNERERERDFTYTLYLIFRIASCYTTYVEKHQSFGRLDCAILTSKCAFVFEFKLDGSAAKALAQINEMGYADEFRAKGLRVYKIGISIDSDKGRIGDWMVEEA